MVYTMYTQSSMNTRIRKWGNSLGLRLPKAALQEAVLSEGSAVDVRVKNGTIIIIPTRPSSYSLEDLLAGVRPDNIHSEIDFGDAKGLELL